MVPEVKLVQYGVQTHPGKPMFDASLVNLSKRAKHRYLYIQE